MTDTPDTATTADATPAAPRELSPAARRALEEAEARRAAAAAEPAPREIRGRGGLEPVRYGDWEIKGLAADF
ncbi:DUF1674 domain-containing protein [Oharaeibacter diazotrophicus]|uniref:DUF1674 domain-containing protein n=1 Tax=Oharaeibacter diazotrophicus TaxID=1920512 RepID=A0A4R6RD36_9HYPH|nr:DUF1674 domain-containing protein [Oharaeibacter diazotrophicus]TDP84042.1 hypothetical protein EDD54_2645 [Oharaeibacter diazotrophicus]BBE73081.1 hypothetical protein OHA_1_02687 [Pleomorphomonas sp. SM30]GLS74870.1 hypothetical protein GCM10007904_02050 [Oharaeibacter diazotrophicus]